MSNHFALKIGYASYVVTPADAAKVMAILSAARCIQSEYLDGRTVYVESNGEDLSFEPMRGEIIPRVERDRLREIESAAWKAERDAKAAPKAAAENGEVAPD